MKYAYLRTRKKGIKFAVRIMKKVIIKTLCCSVRLKSLESISEKAYKAVAFDGSEAIIPKSQVFGKDWEVEKSDAWWIAAWLLDKKDLQHSMKKTAWFDADGNRLPTVIVERHKPDKKEPSKENVINQLKK